MGFIKRKGSYKKPKTDSTEEIENLKSELEDKKELLKAAEEKLVGYEKKGLKLKEKDDKLKEVEEKMKKLKNENLSLTEEIKDLKIQKESLLTPNPKIPKDEESFEHFFMNKNLFERLIRQVLTFIIYLHKF